jgi:GH18 family chitinase
VENYHKNNIKIMVSAGGGSVKPTTEGWNPVTSAKNVANFVKDNSLDGVDLDWEVCVSVFPSWCTKPNIMLMYSFLSRIPNHF